MATPQSAQLFSQAKKVMVGGVNSPVRSFKWVGGEPLAIASGKGATLTDVDGKTYTDYCLSWGALILGHNHPEVIEATQKQLANGTSFGTTTAPEVAIAQFIADNVESIDLIRFVNSGTEATMSAVRLARGYTGRNLVVKFDGCYHGHFDDLLTVAGSGVANLPASSSAGIPQAHIANTLSLAFNDSEELAATLTARKDEIACVIVEAVPGNMGVVLPDPAFLKTLRTLTREFGIVLIFDEVMTGFRTSLGCAQKELGIAPDLTCLGKIIGGGFPIGAYGGKKEIMQALAPLGHVYQAGTFSGNPVVMASGLATLESLNAAVYQSLNERAEKFVRTVNTGLNAIGAKAHLAGYKGMVSLRFSDQPVGNYKEAQAASSATLYPKLFRYLLSEGIYWPPADLEAFFISTMHTDKDLETLADKLVGFFRKII